MLLVVVLSVVWIECEREKWGEWTKQGWVGVLFGVVAVRQTMMRSSCCCANDVAIRLAKPSSPVWSLHDPSVSGCVLNIVFAGTF